MLIGNPPVKQSPIWAKFVRGDIWEKKAIPVLPAGGRTAYEQDCKKACFYTIMAVNVMGVGKG
jgi:hypothetical protein